MKQTLVTLGLGLLLAACKPGPSPAALPTHTPPPPTLSPTIPLPSSPSPTLTALPEPSATPTTIRLPEPTRSPDAIRADTVRQLGHALTVGGAKGPVYGAAASPDGSLVASASGDTLVRIYDAQTGDLLHELDRHRSWAYDVVFSPDGTRMASGGRDQTMQLWEPLTGERISGARTAGEVYRLAFSPDGTRFAAAVLYSTIGNMWDAATGAPLGELGGHHSRLRSVAYSPDGRWLATGDYDGVILLRDPSSGAPVSEVQVDGEALALAFMPDAPLLAVGTGSGQVIIWNLDTETIEAAWQAHGGGTRALVASPDGSLLLSAGDDGAIQVWDGRTFERLKALAAHSGVVYDLDLSLNGAVLVSGGGDSLLQVWRIIP